MKILRGTKAATQFVEGEHEYHYYCREYRDGGGFGYGLRYGIATHDTGTGAFIGSRFGDAQDEGKYMWR